MEENKPLDDAIEYTFQEGKWLWSNGVNQPFVLHQQGAEPTFVALRSKAADPGSEAWLFWQAPTFIGFAKVPSGASESPKWQPEALSANSLDFTLVEDFRLFGPKGEWHFWRTASGSLKGRFRANSGQAGEDEYDETYLLWGAVVDKEASGKHPGWSCLTEERRGMRIWLPRKQVGSLPAKVSVRHFINRDPKSSLAGIVDSMILLIEAE
jgi:CRISPR-associated protein (TIGR03984 family)